MITRPSGMTFNEWANQAVLDLSSTATIGRPDGFNTWQDWAVQVLNGGEISRAAPNPYLFDNWKDWAERLCETIP